MTGINLQFIFTLVDFFLLLTDLIDKFNFFWTKFTLTLAIFD